MGKTTKLWDRKFLGKLKGFDSKEEERLEQKHLKAYLRGDERFTHGKEEVRVRDAYGNTSLIPKYHPVKQELIKL